MEVTDRTRPFRSCRVLETERGGRGQQQQQEEEEEERGGEGALWGRPPRWGLQTSRGPSRRAPGGAAQVVAGRGLVGPGGVAAASPGGAQVVWRWAGIAPRPRPPHPGALARLWAGDEWVSQAGFFLRLWGRRASATERVPPSPIRLWRPPARVFLASVARPSRLAVSAGRVPWREGSNPCEGTAAREGCGAAPTW